jgi:hypothetical protein
MSMSMRGGHEHSMSQRAALADAREALRQAKSPRKKLQAREASSADRDAGEAALSLGLGSPHGQESSHAPGADGGASSVARREVRREADAGPGVAAVDHRTTLQVGQPEEPARRTGEAAAAELAALLRENESLRHGLARAESTDERVAANHASRETLLGEALMMVKVLREEKDHTRVEMAAQSTRTTQLVEQVEAARSEAQRIAVDTATQMEVALVSVRNAAGAALQEEKAACAARVAGLEAQISQAMAAATGAEEQITAQLSAHKVAVAGLQEEKAVLAGRVAGLEGQLSEVAEVAARDQAEAEALAETEALVTEKAGSGSVPGLQAGGAQRQVSCVVYI